MPSGNQTFGLAACVRGTEPSSSRRTFEWMAAFQDPIHRSIGRPHYDPPERLVDAATEAVLQQVLHLRSELARQFA